MALWRLFKVFWKEWDQHPKERAKLVLGSVFFPAATREWLGYLKTRPHLLREASQTPKLATRIYRPYALRTLNCRERVAHMIQHHELLHHTGWGRLTERSSHQPLSISTWPMPDGSVMTLQLVSLKDGHREGETHLQLLWDREWMFSLTFLVCQRHGVQQMLVTRLQGAHGPTASDRIRTSTKALHGLRPADLLVQVAQHLARLLHCREVRLVSNRQRVALNPLRRMRIKVDLDKLWQERGAVPTPDGLFALEPGVAVRTDFSDVASNKRAQARRRADTLQQVLDALESALQETRLT